MAKVELSKPPANGRWNGLFAWDEGCGGQACQGNRSSPAHCAVAAAPSSGAAEAATDRKRLKPHRIAQLQYFGIGHTGVDYVAMDRGGTMEARPGARSAAD